MKNVASFRTTFIEGNIFIDLTTDKTVTPLFSVEQALDSTHISNVGLLNRLIEVHTLLNSQFEWHRCIRALKFMIYDLISHSQTYDEPARVQNLAHYLFKIRNFKLGHSILFNEVMATRDPSPILMAMLYIELATSLGLKMQLVHWAPHTIVKWEALTGQPRYVDLANAGAELSHDDFLALLCKYKDQAQTLSPEETFQQYLSYLVTFYRNRNENEQLHIVYNFILSLDPENKRCLLERALLRKDLGLIKEALQDMKRYFSFVETATVSAEILRAFEELKSVLV